MTVRLVLFVLVSAYLSLLRQKEESIIIFEVFCVGAVGATCVNYCCLFRRTIESIIIFQVSIVFFFFFFLHFNLIFMCTLLVGVLKRYKVGRELIAEACIVI